MQELFNILNTTKNTLDYYYEIHKKENFNNKRNTPKDYLEWIDKKTKIIINSPKFLEKSKEYIVRGDVIWVEFGFNIGKEFSGRHPAVVLKTVEKHYLLYQLQVKNQLKNKFLAITILNLEKYIILKK